MTSLTIPTDGLGNILLQGFALLAAIGISIAFYHSLTQFRVIQSVGRLIGLVIGAEISIFILLCVILPAGLMDEGEIIGPMLLTAYLTPMFWRLKREGIHLAREKERAEVTLRSIGDAVITTDLECKVETLNPVAEQLTGWKSHDARGRVIEDIFTIVNETTREAVMNPARRAIAECSVVELVHNTILISRYGRQLQGGAAVEKAGRQSAETAVAEAGIVLLIDDFFQHQPHFFQYGLGAGIDIQIEHGVAERASHEELQRQVISALGILLVVGGLCFLPAFDQAVAPGHGERSIDVVSRLIQFITAQCAGEVSAEIFDHALAIHAQSGQIGESGGRFTFDERFRVQDEFSAKIKVVVSDADGSNECAR